jgi:uncharacterized membrane protein YphA (DoxX/SURF4 family)
MPRWRRVLFSTFPRGRPGTGLILIRAAVATTALIQGTFCLISDTQVTPIAVGSLLVLVAGILLLVGLWTPIAAAVVALCIGAMRLSLASNCSVDLFQTDVSLILTITVCTGILLAGPGAYSIDARLFGPREIVLRPDSDSRS